jgi:hypothetical protein
MGVQDASVRASKPRGCDLVGLRVEDVADGGEVKSCASIVQRKIGHPMRFEIAQQSRLAAADMICERRVGGSGHMYPSCCA